jgi:hypothetical protein
MTLQAAVMARQARQETKAARPASSFLPAPHRWAMTTVTPVESPQKTVMVTSISSWPRPVAAMAAAPRPPVRKMSTIETRRWKREESSTGMERRKTLRRMETGLRFLDKRITQRADSA